MTEASVWEGDQRGWGIKWFQGQGKTSAPFDGRGRKCCCNTHQVADFSTNLKTEQKQTRKRVRLVRGADARLFYSELKCINESILIAYDTSISGKRCWGAEMPAGSFCSSRRGPKAPCLCPHVNLYRALKEVVLTASIWGQEGARGQALPADMKAHPSTPCSWYLSPAPPDHLYLHNLGLIGPKQKPCVNYLWRCNDFRAAADLHLVSKRGPENRLRFRYVTVVLSPTCPPPFHFRGLFGFPETWILSRVKSGGTQPLHSYFCGLLNE